jgi:hypothetical protein
MPADPKLLYAVTAFVFAALAVWVVAMLRTQKEPWARPLGGVDDGREDRREDVDREGEEATDETSGVKRAPGSASKVKAASQSARAKGDKADKADKPAKKAADKADKASDDESDGPVSEER